MSHHKIVDVIVIWLLVIMVLGVGVYLVKNDMSFTGSFARTFDLVEDPLSTEGFEVANVRAEGKHIKYTAGCKELSTSTTAERAYALHLLYQDRVMVRPTTYDLVRDMISEFGAEVKVLKIFKLREGIYAADLILQQGDKIIKFDTRPSDALAVAVKEKKPIYVESRLLEEDGINIC